MSSVQDVIIYTLRAKRWNISLGISPKWKHPKISFSPISLYLENWRESIIDLLKNPFIEIKYEWNTSLKF
jgi:hypothetical protein